MTKKPKWKGIRHPSGWTQDKDDPTIWTGTFSYGQKSLEERVLDLELWRHRADYRGVALFAFGLFCGALLTSIAFIIAKV